MMLSKQAFFAIRSAIDLVLFSVDTNKWRHNRKTQLSCIIHNSPWCQQNNNTGTFSQKPEIILLSGNQLYSLQI